MLRRTASAGCGLVILFWIATAPDAAIRINGNQFIVGSAYHDVAGSEAVPSTLVFSLGQAMLITGALPDSGSGTTFGTGLGYDIANIAYEVFTSPVAMTGDVNLSATLTSADIIFLVNFVFKTGPDPIPCEAAGDVNCSGAVTSADIIFMVGHVFKSGPLPCDVNSLIPGTWSCSVDLQSKGEVPGPRYSFSHYPGHVWMQAWPGLLVSQSPVS